MQCPYCGEGTTKVKDSRETDNKIRRRRECSNCSKRFTTYETVERFDVKVEKQDGEIEDFDQEKIREGVAKAVKKTPASEEVEEIVDEVKKEILGREIIKSEKIGQTVKEALKKRNEVAYMRFASVYDSFEDVESFKKEIKALEDSK